MERDEAAMKLPCEGRRRYPINCGRTGAIEILSFGDCYTPWISARAGKAKRTSPAGKQPA